MDTLSFFMRKKTGMHTRTTKCFVILTVITLAVYCYPYTFRNTENVKPPLTYTTVMLQQKTNFNKYNKSQKYICIDCLGEIDIQMFQFASAYGIAILNAMTVVTPKKCKLLSVFNVTAVLATNMSFCRYFRKLTITNNAVYDRKILEYSNNESASLVGYLTEYRYLDKYESNIRKQFSFRSDIKTKVDKILETIFFKNNLTCVRIVCHNEYKPQHNRIKCYKSDSNDIVTIIGVYLQKNDWFQQPHPEQWHQTSSAKYVHRAMQWFQNMYKNLIVIVGTNGTMRAQQNMPGNISIVHLEGNTPEIDMAILASCNHFIVTTGTLSWWIGWLIGGKVTYHKLPLSDQKHFRKTFKENYTDYFHPSWIGL